MVDRSVWQEGDQLSVNVLDRARESEVDEEYEKELQEKLRFVDTCPECREKLAMGAGVDDLDARCSELLREGIGGGIKK